MKILDRYIGKQLIASILIVTFGLLNVDLFFYLVNELRYVGKGDYTLGSALIFIILTIPRKIYIIFPWAALLGSLLALGALAKNSELVAMRVASVSVKRIAGSALKAGLWLTIIMFICGEVISPKTEIWAQQRKTLALSRGQAIQTESGTWVRHENQFIHVGSVKGKNDLQDVTRYDFGPDLQLNEVIHANSAKKQDHDWLLTQVKGTKFSDSATIGNDLPEKLKVIDNNEANISNLLDIEILQASAVKHLERLTIKNLWRLIKSRVEQELNATEYQHAFWLKIMQPIASLVMIFLAVPFAFGPLRSSSMGLKILVGVIVGFSFHTLNSIFGPLTELVGLSPMLAAMIPSALFLGFGYWMIQRVR